MTVKLTCANCQTSVEIAPGQYCNKCGAPPTSNIYKNIKKEILVTPEEKGVYVYLPACSGIHRM